MRRIAWLVGLASLAVLGGVDRVQASPLKLELWGSAQNFYIPSGTTKTIDVSNGFSGYTQTGGGMPLQHQWEAESWQKPINDSIHIGATLYDADRILAWVMFSAPITGTLYYAGGTGRFSARAHGSAVGELHIESGVDPSLIPSWFTGMTATADTFVSDGRINGYYTTVTITPGPAAPVPEPSSVLVFLAAAGCVGYRRLRRA
ncbi:MAG: PEP-CTERM sorting domain-containing protein [Paludisphaera borealis]|uniref:PEP-CTERM sorting domain-containing protein n=1 Tax=Paludisphaera borealis TaxID=1387353 RepID=UPI002846F05E|nr:PEP-CTERM sorting domain-containing protein [Paludisphaera borealis]MDR3620168.1 PEP-CTERM sorting domain-containing protein [Paludisphaera borealis]